jgi:hypothetical protein
MTSRGAGLGNVGATFRTPGDVDGRTNAEQGSPCRLGTPFVASVTTWITDTDEPYSSKGGGIYRPPRTVDPPRSTVHRLPTTVYRQPSVNGDSHATRVLPRKFHRRLPRSRP